MNSSQLQKPANHTAFLEDVGISEGIPWFSSHVGLKILYCWFRTVRPIQMGSAFFQDITQRRVAI